ncbi:MAG: molybdopterin molybdotransferase MoeA [Conexivisphaerales archaeon]
MTLIKDEEAERLIDGLPLKMPRVKSVSTCNAVNMLSSENVTSPSDLPENGIAAQDGYAINIMDGAMNYTVKDSAVELKPGEATYVGTGWTIPSGANSVIRIESAKVDGNKLFPIKDPKPWGDIEMSGDDVKRGSIIIERGKMITPYHISLFSALGLRKVKVFDLRVGIINVGDEIVKCNSPKKGIRDSITPLLKGLMPFASFRTAHAPDDKTKIVSLIERFSRACDLVMTIGGSSVGKKDLTKDAIKDVGEIVFEGVQTNIVKRGGVGFVNGTPVLSLPGRIVSAVTVFHVHGLHIISKLVGSELRKYGEVSLSEGIVVRHSMNSTFLFKVEDNSATPLKWGAGLYSQIIKANAFARLERNRDYSKGEKIRIQFLIKS